MANDSLARGAKSAVFPSNSHIAQNKWDAAFKDIPLTEKKSDGAKRPNRKASKN
jgi:hypothetical protein